MATTCFTANFPKIKMIFYRGIIFPWELSLGYLPIRWSCFRKRNCQSWEVLNLDLDLDLRSREWVGRDSRVMRSQLVRTTERERGYCVKTRTENRVVSPSTWLVKLLILALAQQCPAGRSQWVNKLIEKRGIATNLSVKWRISNSSLGSHRMNF